MNYIRFAICVIVVCIIFILLVYGWYLPIQTSKSLTFYRESEIQDVVFLKVAKTGSSTVQNIFFRFAESRNLTVALPHSKKSLKESCCDNVISFNNSLTDTNILQPPPGRHLEVLCSHVIYNRTQMRKYFPKDTTFVGIVREPISRLESAIRYYSLYPNVPLHKVSENPFLYNKIASMTSENNGFQYPLVYMSNNRMAFEFGFPKDLFPTKVEDYTIAYKTKKTVQDYIKMLDHDFIVILINEKLDESLVLMKRPLHWKTSDILYMKQNVAKKKYNTFKANEREKIKSYLHLDFAIYNFAVKRLDEQIKKQSSDFLQEVAYFKSILEKLSAFCKHLARPDNVLQLNESKWNDNNYVRMSDCAQYTTKEIPFTKATILRLYNTLNN